MTFKAQIQQGIPDVLPSVKKYELINKSCTKTQIYFISR